MFNIYIYQIMATKYKDKGDISLFDKNSRKSNSFTSLF